MSHSEGYSELFWGLWVCPLEGGTACSVAPVCILGCVQIDTEVIRLCVCMGGHTSYSLLCPLREPRSSDTPTAMSTSSTQILVSKCHSPIKGTSTP